MLIAHITNDWPIVVGLSIFFITVAAVLIAEIIKSE